MWAFCIHLHTSVTIKRARLDAWKFSVGICGNGRHSYFPNYFSLTGQDWQARAVPRETCHTFHIFRKGSNNIIWCKGKVSRYIIKHHCITTFLWGSGDAYSCTVTAWRCASISASHPGSISYLYRFSRRLGLNVVANTAAGSGTQAVQPLAM